MRLMLAAALLIMIIACAKETNDINENVLPSVNMREVVEMKLTSQAFQGGSKIPSTYTCDGKDAIPPLQITDVPINAKSLALVVDDPDAPVGMWDHWVLWNIDPKTTEVKENQPPKAVYGKNSWKRTSWGGPCPPDREHRYFFKLYALDALLNLPEGSAKKELENAMKGHVVAQAELVGRYERIR